MRELGYVSDPDQYDSAEDLVLIENSVDAFEFFRERYGDNGLVFLCQETFYSFEHPFTLLWVYVDPIERKILSMLPVFKDEDYQEVHKSQIKNFTLLHSSVFFLRKNILLGAVITSSGEIIIKKIRSILYESNVAAICRLRYDLEVINTYPVELYSITQSKSMGTYWAVYLDGFDLPFYELASYDDLDDLKQFEGDLYKSYPIELGETATIGGKLYTLCYQHEFGPYFQCNAVQSRLSVSHSQNQTQNESHGIRKDLETKQPQIFFKPKFCLSSAKSKSSNPGKYLIMDMNGTKNAETSTFATEHPHIIHFHPKK